MILEIAVFDIEGAIVAEKAGANRIELCVSYSEGGISPSHGSIKWAAENIKIPVFVMIRPRGGSFIYTEEEIEIMKNDIAFCRDIGVDGVVFGILDDSGNVHVKNCTALIETAGNMQLTFHRAFDRVVNPIQAIEDIISCGFHRILTSGQENTAEQGIENIKQYIKTADDRIIIMPGSGINENNLLEIHRQLDLEEYHASVLARNTESAEVNSLKGLGAMIPEMTNSWEKIVAMQDLIKKIRD